MIKFAWLAALLSLLVLTINAFAAQDPPEIEVDVRQSKTSAPTTDRTKVSQAEIANLPGGDQVPLSHLVNETVPGAVAGPVGQLFFRGTYEGSAQYQLDGIPLPDLPTVRFGEIFPTQSVERIEVLTGAFPAEYGERLGGVINVITKSGGPTAGGEVGLGYGSYDTLTPSLSYGGASTGGSFHYFAAANYQTTRRALNTPQPNSSDEVNRGGEEAVHDRGLSHNELLKLDWHFGEPDSLTLLFFNSTRALQIPNFPGPYSASDPYFTVGDAYSNPPYRYVPPYTSDMQTESDHYLQAVWKHAFSDNAFLQVAPYWKGSTIKVNNDLENDLLGVHSGQTYASFSEDREVNSFGIHADFTQRWNEHRFKAGVFAETAKSGENFALTAATDNPSNRVSYNGTTPVSENQQAVYVQDDYALTEALTINAGIRLNFTQLSLPNAENFTDSAFQPRLGASYKFPTNTVVHAYYGKLYHNAPPDDFRSAFRGVSGVSVSPYDVKSENADYYEVGVTQRWQQTQLVALTGFYRSVNNLIDDEPLLNTYLSQPVNFAYGYVKGADLAVKGALTNQLDYFANYAYLQAKVRGLSGGVFTKDPGENTSGWQNLDTAQTHTASAGLHWRPVERLYASLQGQYGSGIPTAPNNTSLLPAHLTFDASVGHDFRIGEGHCRISADLLNLFDNPYPITIANGITGSQYSAGREYFVRLSIGI